MTTVADGLFQFGGVPVSSGALTTNKIFFNNGGVEKKGRSWFVDASIGTSGDGKSPQTAFSTMERAFDSLASGDIIYFVGKVTEQLVAPVQIFDVTVVGCGNRPRHADATPAGGNWAAATWAAPATPVAGQALVRVLQQGWRFVNILFAGSAGCASIELVRNAEAGDDERDASHCEILGCRFAGVDSTDYGVKFGATSFTEYVNNTLIQDCDFQGCATAIGGTSAYRAQVRGNRFTGNTNCIVGIGYEALIVNNYIGVWDGTGINLTGGVGNNIVTANYLYGDYSTASDHYVSTTGDEWSGNWSSDEAETEVVNAITVAVPAS